MSLRGMEVPKATEYILGNFKDGSIGGRFIYDDEADKTLYLIFDTSQDIELIHMKISSFGFH